MYIVLSKILSSPSLPLPLPLQLAALPEDSCLSVAPRPRSVARKHSLDLSDKDSPDIEQNPNVPEVETLEKVKHKHCTFFILSLQNNCDVQMCG